MRKTLRCIFFLCLLYSQPGFSQSRIDSLLSKLDPQKFTSAVAIKANKLQQKFEEKAVKVLKQMQKQEKRLYEKMLKGKDSLLARVRLTEMDDRYNALKSSLKAPAPAATARHYVPTLDSLNTSLKFLSENAIIRKGKDALAKTELLQGKFDQAEQIKKFIKERKELLKQQLEKLGLARQLKKINKTVYYYSAQIKEYKEILSDPMKIEKKSLQLLSKTKLFKDFMRKNSLLASMFGIPADPGAAGSQPNLTGLQTRAQINSIIQQQFASGGPNAQQQIQQNIQAAQSQLTELKNKIPGRGNDNDVDMPDFKPNNQKAKSFLKRLEYGANIQNQKANYFFPTTSDVGLSVGYKLNDKSVIGIGASYKVGLGRGWNDITISHQGIGLRSYMDLKLKGSLWVSGGYEQNYRSAFSDIDQLRDRTAWQQSGLIGISKKNKISKKYSAKFQLLWDFLSYQQIPRTQPVVLRIGLSLK